LADLPQIEAERVERGLDGEVELRPLLLLRERRLLVRRMLVRLPLDQLDRVVDQVRVEVLDLLLRELDVFEPGDDLVVGEEAFLLPVLDELLEFFYIWEGDVDGEHGPRLSALGGTGARTALDTQRAGTPCPRLTYRARDLTQPLAKPEPISSQFRHDLATLVAAAVQEREPSQTGLSERVR